MISFIEKNYGLLETCVSIRLVGKDPKRRGSEVIVYYSEPFYVKRGVVDLLARQYLRPNGWKDLPLF